MNMFSKDLRKVSAPSVVSGTILAFFLVFSLLAAGCDAASGSPILTDEEAFTSSEYYSSVETEMNITPPPPAVRLDFVYHNYVALTDFLRNVSFHYPGLTHLYSIGQSVLKRELWVLAVSSTPDRHVAGKPEMKYVGNIHGNEPVSKEILLHLILHLVSGYGHDPVITLLLDYSRIHFLVSMNPDGFEKSAEGTCSNDKGRKNQKDFDLNRNFPDHFQHNHFPLQPETKAVMQWMSNVPFVLSAGLHGGALVASYPFENHVNRALHIHEREENPTPDDDVFRHLATVYAKNHATMWMGKPCKPKSESFVGGIVNGAKWYTFVGGMQDYNYIVRGTMEITLEVSCCKHPMASTLRQHWLDNRKALILYMYEALRGVKGFVTDEESGRPVSGAQLHVRGRHHGFNTTADGEYWRILLNGSYILQVSAEGYQPHEESFEVMGDEATVLNVTLRRLAVSLSSTTSSPTLPPLTSVTGTVEEVINMDSTNTTESSFDESSGDGNHNTQHPNGVDPNKTSTSTPTISATSNETITNDLPTNPITTANGANDDDEDDDEDDGDEDNMPSLYNMSREPRMDAVKSTASSFVATALGGKDAMRLRLISTLACTFILSKLLLN